MAKKIEDITFWLSEKHELLGICFIILITPFIIAIDFIEYVSKYQSPFSNKQ